MTIEEQMADFDFKNITTGKEAHWEKHQNTSYEEAQILLKESHYKVMQLIETFLNIELFTNKYLVSSNSGKTGFEGRQPFFDKFQHGRYLGFSKWNLTF